MVRSICSVVSVSCSDSRDTPLAMPSRKPTEPPTSRLRESPAGADQDIMWQLPGNRRLPEGDNNSGRRRHDARGIHPTDDPSCQIAVTTRGSRKRQKPRPGRRIRPRRLDRANPASAPARTKDVSNADIGISPEGPRVKSRKRLSDCRHGRCRRRSALPRIRCGSRPSLIAR